VRSLKAYLNAIQTEQAILAALEEATKVRSNFNASAKADEVSEPVAVFIIIDSRDGKKSGSLSFRARHILSMFTNM